jgi:hypothetical protein
MQVTLCASAIHNTDEVEVARNQISCSMHLLPALQDPSIHASVSRAANPPFSPPPWAWYISPRELMYGAYESPCCTHGKVRMHQKVRFDLRVWLHPKRRKGFSRTGSGSHDLARHKPREDSNNDAFCPGISPIVRVEIFGDWERPRSRGLQMWTKLHATLWPHETTCTKCAGGQAGCTEQSDPDCFREHILLLVHSRDLEDRDRCRGIADAILAFCRGQATVRNSQVEYDEKQVVVTFSDSVPEACWAGLPIERPESSDTEGSSGTGGDSEQLPGREAGEDGNLEDVSE